MYMKEVINFIKIPKKLFYSVGQPDSGTRYYRQYGDNKRNQEWWDSLMSIQKGISFFSPGGAASFVGVSRPAVYKRMKEGRLTAFSFYKVVDKKFLFVNYQSLSNSGLPVEVYIPWCELKDWKNYIVNRNK